MPPSAARREKTCTSPSAACPAMTRPAAIASCACHRAARPSTVTRRRGAWTTTGWDRATVMDTTTADRTGTVTLTVTRTETVTVAQAVSGHGSGSGTSTGSGSGRESEGTSGTGDRGT
eukprot:2740815-Rhodomonas_salina.1